MRLIRLLAIGLAACTTTVSSPASPTPNGIGSPTETGAPAPIATTSSNVPAAPQRSVLTFYRTEDVSRGSAVPSKRLDISAPIYGIGFGPNPRWAIVFGVGDQTPVRLLDLESGALTNLALTLSPDDLHPTSTVRWLADGRLLITGRQVWIGGPRGEDLQSVFDKFPFEVVPSPSGKKLAITTHDSSAIVVLDLAAGNTATLAGPFRRCGQDAGIRIVWAPDDRALAATDCSDPAQGGMQTRFVSVADGREIRSLADLSIWGWLPSGDVLAAGPFRPRVDRELWVVGVDGTRRALPTVGFMLSPDGRFLAGSVVRGAATTADPTHRAHFAQLVEVATGRVLEVGEGLPVGWTAQGEIALVTLI